MNDPPTAVGQTLLTQEDTALNIKLTGLDVEGDALTFAVQSPPQHGILSGTASDLVYTPDADFAGQDSFSFTANDGSLDSTPATVSLEVVPVNDPPVAQGQSLQTDEDIALNITLGGSDVDGDTLTFSVSTGPQNGTLTGTAPALTYTPNPGYSGSDSFSFVANDGTVDSTPATVQITVTPAPSEAEVFRDSFEIGEWNGLWTEDRQNDWFRSTQRATDGSYSAEIDGRASDASLTSTAIDLQGRTSARITFDWLIEKGLDAGEVPRLQDIHRWRFHLAADRDSGRQCRPREHVASREPRVHRHKPAPVAVPWEDFRVERGRERGQRRSRRVLTRKPRLNLAQMRPEPGILTDAPPVLQGCSNGENSGLGNRSEPVDPKESSLL